MTTAKLVVTVMGLLLMIWVLWYFLAEPRR